MPGIGIIMESFDSKQDMMEYITEQLLCGCRVYYDIDSLKCLEVLEDMVLDYLKFMDMDDVEFDKAAQEYDFNDMLDLVKELRNVYFAYECIKQPDSNTRFQWMEDFIDNHRHLIPFTQKAVFALSRRHPFRNFKDIVYDYRLEEEWFSHEREHMREYVYDELGCQFAIEG